MNKADIVIKELGPKDLIEVQQLFMLLQEVFDVDHPTKVSQTYLEKLLKSPLFIVFVAMSNKEVIGGLAGYLLPMYNRETSEFYIYDIAVTSKFQRMGIGRQLIEAAKKCCLENGIKTMFVQANIEDTHALDFYRSTKAGEESVVQFTYLL